MNRRRAQFLRQIAQPADVMTSFVPVDDCAEERGLSDRPLLESPDTDRDKYFATVRQVGVDFRAGGQVITGFARNADWLAAFGHLPDHAGVRADDLVEPASEVTLGQRLVEFGSGHLLR